MLKFSSSPSVKGQYRINIKKINDMISTPSASFIEKNRLKLILVVLEERPRGFLEPCRCKNVMCTSTNETIRKGKRK